MSGSSGSRTAVVQRALVALQVFLLIATLIGPAAVMANEPTPDPTPAPSAEPTVEPSAEPSAEPTAEPTAGPTTEPSAIPTAEPSVQPTPAPNPTADPTPEPTVAPTAEPTPSSTATPVVIRPYVVSFVAGTAPAEQTAAIAASGATTTDTIGVLRIHAVNASDDSVALLRADARVGTVELDRSRAVEAAPDDASYGDQWALPMIGWDQAYGVVDPAGTAVVAILDTGVDASHPDLDGNIVSGASFVAGSSWSSDPNGHGTSMAGIVAAETNNGSGIAGVGYDGVSVMPITVLGADGLGRDSDIVEGLVWAADHGADVILMSFSATGYSSALQAAIDYAWSAGVVLVAAAGNDGSSTPAFPAGDAGVIGVSATTSSDGIAGFSNTGEAVFLGAPGAGIVTIGGSVSGTSAAAAHVAGAAALLAAADSAASNGVIVGRLARNADAVGSAAETGNGRLNLARALSDAATDAVKPAGAAPVGDGGPFVGPYVVAGNTDVTGAVRSSAAGNPGIAGATVSCTAGCSDSATTLSTGAYSIKLNYSGNSASVTLMASAPGYASSSVTFTANNNVNQTRNFILTPSNAAPTATNLSAAETYTEDTALNLVDIVASDVDSASVTATLTLSNVVAGSLTTATSGAVTSTYNAGTGVWTASGAIANVNTLLAGVSFVPALNSSVSFNIATSVSDGVAAAITGTKAVTGVPVNDAPTATNLSAAETYTEDTALNLVDIVVSDIDSANVTATLTLSNTAAGSLNTATSGAVTSTYNAGTGVWTASGAIASVNTLLAGLTFTPAANFNANFTIATSVSDGVAAAVTGSKAVTGVPVNDAPTATNLSAAETYTEDTALNLVDIVVSDIDSANVTATLTLSNTAAGSLNTATSGAVTSTYNAGTGVWTASGAIASVNTLLAGLTFTPAANFNANFTIATSVSDGVAAAVTGSKAVTGVPVNDAPTATDIANQTISEDANTGALAFTVGDAETAAGSLTVSGSSSNTTLVPNANIVFGGSGASRTVTVTPALNQSGTSTITVTVSDGSLSASDTFVLTVTAVDDAPVAVDDAETVLEDAAATAIAVLANDTDVDGGPKSIASVAQPTNGTVAITGGGTGLTYKPNLNYCNGGTPTDDFTYTLNGGSTATVRMTVTCVDDAPVAVDDAETVLEDAAATAIAVLANDTDVDGGPKSIASVAQPTNGTVAITGGGTGLTYKPNLNYCNGGTPTDDFTYTLNGGSTATVRMTVTCVDDAPVAVDDAETVLEDAAATAIAVLANDTDVDGGPKSIASVAQPTNGTVAITGGGTGLTYKPNLNYCNGGTPTDDFTYTLNGGSTATVRMTVTCVNDAPVVVVSGDFADVNEGVTRTYTYTVTDVDSASPTVTESCTGDALFISDLAANSFKCKFLDGPGGATVTVTADDGGFENNLGSNERIVTVNNVAPTVTVTAGPTSVNEGATEHTFTYTISDPGIDTVSSVSTSCGTEGTKVTGSDSNTDIGGSFRCVFPDGNVPADTSSVSAQATDSDGAAGNTATRIVTVNNVAPTVTVTGASPVNESQTAVEYTFTTTDPGTDTFSAGTPSCGTSGTYVGMSLVFSSITGDGTFECLFADDNPTATASDLSTVSITITDDDTDATTGSKVVTVNNVAPTVTVTGASPVNESQTAVEYTFTTTDPGTDTFSAGTPSCGTSGTYVGMSLVFSSITGDGTFECLFADDNPTATASDLSTVSITITDDDTDATTGSKVVTVNNVAPTVTVTGASPVNESQTAVEYTFTTTDPGTDTFSAGTPSCGTSGTYVGMSLVFSSITGDGTFECLFADDNPTATASDLSTVSITITDDDTDATTGSKVVTVNNVAPTVTVTGASPVNESQTAVEYTFTTTDPGTDTFSAGTPSCGTSGTYVGMSLVFSSITGDGTFECLFADDNPTATASDLSTVSITITDDDTDATTGSKVVTVNNVAPTVTVTGASPVNESQTAVEYTFTTTDPGTDTFSAGTPSCGTSGTYVGMSLVFSSITGDGTFECLFADDNPTATASDLSTVSITITDDDTDATTGSKVVTVNNVAPTTSNPVFTFDAASHIATAKFDFSDAGTADSHLTTYFIWTINGVDQPASTATVTELNGSGTATSIRVLATGCYTISVRGYAVDDDGGVSAAQPITTTFTADAYGASFKAPIKDNERNIAKYGNVVPIKLELASSCSPGTTVTTPVLHITIASGNVADVVPDSTPVIVAESVSSADTGTQMRVNGGGYIYNFTTKNLSAGQDYTIRIRVGSTTGPIILRALFQPKK